MNVTSKQYTSSAGKMRIIRLTIYLIGEESDNQLVDIKKPPTKKKIFTPKACTPSPKSDGTVVPQIYAI